MSPALAAEQGSQGQTLDVRRQRKGQQAMLGYRAGGYTGGAATGFNPVGKQYTTGPVGVGRGAPQGVARGIQDGRCEERAVREGMAPPLGHGTW